MVIWQIESELNDSVDSDFESSRVQTIFIILEKYDSEKHNAEFVTFFSMAYKAQHVGRAVIGFLCRPE